MNGQPVAGTGNSPDPKMSRGLNVLVRPIQAPENAAKQKELLPAWFFFCADLLLLAYTVVICLSSSRPLDTGTILYCAGAIALGALLSIVGIVRASN